MRHCPPDESPWIMVETLAPDTATVVSAGGDPREFSTLPRTVDRLLKHLKTIPADYNPMIQRKVRQAIDSVRRTARPFEKPVKIGDTEYPLIALPVYGPDKQVHAVQFWFGSPQHTRPEPRRAAGVVWDLNKQVIIQPFDSTRLSGVPDDEFIPEVSISEIFDRASQEYDGHDDVLKLIYDPKPGDKIRFEVTVPHMEGKLMLWQVSIRARDDEECKGAWWMWEDITSAEHPPRYPTLQQVGYHAAHRTAETYVAVVMVAYSTIPYWLTDPAPWIRWNFLHHPVDVFHPEDRQTLWKLSAELDPGKSTEIVVRTLDYEGGYTPTRVLLSPYPGYTTGKRLMIGQFIRADDRTERIPLEPVADLAPHEVGYDDQMQRRLRRWPVVPHTPGQHWSQTDT